MEEAVQGGVDPREDWDQAAAAAWAPGAPPTSQPVARRCPRPPRLLQARYVGVDGGLCVYVHVCAWRGRGGEKGRGGNTNSNSLRSIPRAEVAVGHPGNCSSRACPATEEGLVPRCQCRPRSQAGERGGIENRTS